MAYRTESYIVMQQTTLAKHEVILSDNKSHLQDINDHCKCFMVVAELGRTKVGYFGLLPRWYAHFLDDSGGFPVF